MSGSSSTTTPQPFPIVGVGASAGGVEALEGLFRGMPRSPGLAVVVVTHIGPDRQSVLHEIVSRYTEMRVVAAADGDMVEVNRVYILSMDAVVGIEGRRLKLTRQHPDRRERKPIDLFFSALAVDQGEYSAGVVLSGGDGDGALGIKVIKEHGGLTLAQADDRYGPAHPDMPRSAISTGLVDFAVPAQEMGAKLAEFARNQAVLDRMGAPTPEAEGAASLDAARTEIYDILRKEVGHNFAGYKVKTFLRRVQRRMQVRQLTTVAAYVACLRQDAAEAQALFRDLLINVTNFFRDAEAFENLAALVIPRLFEGRGPSDTVRVWVPGCATGEEVYSISILLREHMDGLAEPPRVQVFATDIDEHALGVARGGRYPGVLLGAVSPERRARFFLADGNSFVLAKEVRDLCVFSPHSVIRDPPFSRMDLVSCRNLLIYFGPDLQGQVIPTFHYSLRPEGYLFLGTSENISQFQDLFAPMDKRHRIFRRRDDVAGLVRLPLMMRNFRPAAPSDMQTLKPAGSLALRQSVQSQVLDRFAPPHVAVNGEGDVVFYSAKTGKYLEAAAGLPTRQLLTVARKGLRLDLRVLLREAAERKRAVTRSGVAVEGDDGRVQVVTLSVEPILEHEGEPLYLVLFIDEGPTVSREDDAVRTQSLRDSVNHHLEQELRDTRDRLQSLVEEYETALEELKSSNEELQSVNEEFQSTNEELEASKEELQSVNEELHTVNMELNVKVEALDRANSDLQNLFDSTNVATIFLDRSLVIRSFTPAVERLLNVRPGDRGRPVTDLSGRIDLPDLVEDVAAIMGGAELIERRVDPVDGHAHYLVRITPYRDDGHGAVGAVVTFVDITGLTRSEARLRVLVAELQHRTRNLLGVVQAIARQTVGRGGLVEDFMERLAALGRVQGLISMSSDDTVELGELIRLEVRAHGADEAGHVFVDGPCIQLNLGYVHPIALVIHELATNAVKHGALRPGNGRLSVTWRIEARPEEEWLMLEWRENGVPMAPGSGEQSGFGKTLIERSLESTLRARTRLEFDHDGVCCRIEVPLGRLAVSGIPAPHGVAAG